MVNSTQHVFLDTNIVIDLILKRPRYAAVERELRQYSQLSISSLTLATTYYIINQSVPITPDEYNALLVNFTVLSVGGEETKQAFSIVQDEDLEDAIQVACAMTHRVDVFLTADRKLASKYKQYLSIRVIDQ